MTDLLDFDTLSRLAQEDPDAFEEYRKATLEGYFSSLPEEQSTRARQLQWRLDGELLHIKDPLARMNHVMGKMFESVYELNDLLNGYETEYK